MILYDLLKSNVTGEILFSWKKYENERKGENSIQVEFYCGELRKSLFEGNQYRKISVKQSPWSSGCVALLLKRLMRPLAVLQPDSPLDACPNLLRPALSTYNYMYVKLHYRHNLPYYTVLVFSLKPRVQLCIIIINYGNLHHQLL